MYILRFKTCRRHVPEVRTFASFVHVADWLEREQGGLLEVALYADGLPLTGTRIESCRLAVYKSCTLDPRGPKFHREFTTGDVPLVIAWNRRNHPK